MNSIPYFKIRRLREGPGWADSSVGNVLALQTRRPKCEPQNPGEKVRLGGMHM